MASNVNVGIAHTKKKMNIENAVLHKVDKKLETETQKEQPSAAQSAQFKRHFVCNFVETKNACAVI